MRYFIVLLATTLPLATLLPACYSTSPIYEATVTGPAGTIEYSDPAWESGIRWTGWGLVLLSTGGGAYAGYTSGLKVGWTEGEPGYEEPIANAAIMGVSSGLTAMIVNALFKPVAPAYDAADAEKWLAELDEQMALVETGRSSRKEAPSILAIDRGVESTLLPRDTTELGIFLRAFPASSRRDSVGLHAAATFNRRFLPFVVAEYTDETPGTNAKQRYAREASGLDEAVQAAEQYPEVRETAESRAAAFVENHRDAITFIRKFPESPLFPEVVSRLLPELRTSEIELLLPHVIDSGTRRQMGRVLLDSAGSVTAILDIIEAFPHLHSHGESRAASIVRTTTDLRTFIATFPESDAAPGFRTRLLEKLRVPENAGVGINTTASEYAPVITPDGSTLYFTRRFTNASVGDYDDEDIWFSTIQSDGTWSIATNLRELNNKQSNGVNSVTPDGNTLLIHGEYGSRYWTAPASLAHRTSRGWTTPVALQIDGYHNLGDYMQTFLANDGRTLLLALERTEGRGQHDLYVSFLGTTGEWSRPQNLGPQINTRRADDTPFLASDGRTLYFASEGHGGEGGSDLFVTRRLDDTWRKWSKPQNLGKPINTADDDSFFFIPASGDVAYFSSDRSGEGQSDIFRVALPEDRRPLPVVLVSGIVRDRSTGEPIEAEIVYEDLKTGREVGRARTNPSTGEYKLTLPPGTSYGFSAEAAGFIAIADNLDLSALKAYREQTRDLELVPLRLGETLRLNNLFFDVGRASLRSESFPELDRLAAIMTTRSTMTIEITGHTDSVGTAEDNLRLSRERAASVAAHLRKKGVTTTRATVVGRGEEDPVSTNGTDQGRAMNRRVEIRITGE